MRAASFIFYYTITQNYPNRTKMRPMLLFVLEKRKDSIYALETVNDKKIELKTVEVICMKKKLMISMIAVMILIFSVPVSTYACTAVYVGKEVSEDGTVIIARTGDGHPLYNPVKLERCISEDTAGKVYRQVTNNFSWKLPDRTYDYVCAPQWECNSSTDGRYAAYALNEKGLNLTAAVTAYVCDAAKEADPYATDGIAEEGITDILGASCKTAREAVKLAAKICDEKGSNESNILLFNDRKEAWYMEIYTGHQYAAVKMPTDKVAVFCNEFMLEYLEDYDEVITSPNLLTLPEEAGFAEYDSDGRLNLFNTYAGKGRLADYANMRTWYGHFVFSPSTAGKYYTKKKYPLFFEPDEKVAVTDVMKLFRSRFEDTEYYADINDDGSRRVIGTETQQMAHVIQTFTDFPNDRCSIAWTSVSQAECAPFLPVFGCMNQFDPAFTKDNADYVIDDEAAYSVFKELNTLCITDRATYKTAVSEYWTELENHLVKTAADAMKTASKLSPDSAYRYLTKFGMKEEKAAFENAKIMADEVLLDMAQHSDTLKLQFDYSTLKYSKPIERKPFELSLKNYPFR